MIWKLLAKILALPWIADYLIKRAKRTPYSHLDGYMERYWLVPYVDHCAGFGCYRANPRREPLIALIQRMGFAIRVHHILRQDLADHPHDHPWNARTVGLKNGYTERRREVRGVWIDYKTNVLRPGDTATINFGEFHKITHVAPGGAWTLFITGKYIGTWGFLVNGRKIPWREYEGRN